MTLEGVNRRVERILIVVMILGLLAMFRPWVKELIGLFGPFAPVLLRYGFLAVFLSTVAYIVLTHCSVTDLRRAAGQKGAPLTAILIAMLVLYGFDVILHLSQDHRQAALLGMLHFVFAWPFGTGSAGG